MAEPVHVKLLRQLLRLYPSDFRARHGVEIVTSARAAARAGSARATRVLLDALLTLARAWLYVASRWASRWTARMDVSRAAAAVTRDAALGLRTLRRRPLQGVVIVLTLAVALGANAAIYTVAHALLLERLPYDGADRIVEVTDGPIRILLSGESVSWGVGTALTDHPGVEAAATYYPDAGANLVTGVDASRVRITHVSPEFFDVLGVRMLLGNGIGESGAGDAVLGYDLWRNAFGGDPGVLGRSILLSGRSYRVAGVAPLGVEFPAGTQLWLADPPAGEFFGGAFGPSVVARLRPGAFGAVRQSLAANAAVQRSDAGEAAQYIRDPELISLRAYLTQDVRVPLIVLSAAAAALLLLGCVNVAGVSVARVAARTPELAMRQALGASRVRLFGQLLAELAVLAVVAGVLSALLAWAAVPVLVGLLPAGTAGLDLVRPDGWTLIFTGAAMAAAALLAGVPPALAGIRGRREAAHPDRLRIDDRAGRRFHGMLTSLQVALAMVLVTTASLLGRSLVELRAVPLGYSTKGVLTFSVRLPSATYAHAADMRQYTDDVRRRLTTIPGVQVVGVTDRLPLAEGMSVGGLVRRVGAPAENGVTAGQVVASDDYFAAMGIRILAGRTFAPGDDPAATVILSRQLASSLFEDGRAIGERVTVRPSGTELSGVVVGVVDDVRGTSLEQAPGATLYAPLSSAAVSSPAFTVRTAGSPAALTPLVRRVLAEVDASVAPHALRTTGDAVAETLAARRAAALIALLFGGASLLLALMAVYTLLAHGVVRRRREIGVRLALGATSRQIEGSVVARGLVWTFSGAAAGVLLSLASTRLLQSLLFGVAPRDPVVLAGTAGLVLMAATVASWLPARRAGRVDATVSMRQD